MIVVNLYFVGSASVPFDDKCKKLGEDEIVERAINKLQFDFPHDIDLADIEVCYDVTDYE